MCVAAVDMTPPTRKMKQPMNRPHLRPVRWTMGAAPSAPKKAPTCRRAGRRVAKGGESARCRGEGKGRPADAQTTLLPLSAMTLGDAPR